MKIVIKSFTAWIAIIGVVILEYKALSLGINGVLLSGAIAVIASIAAYQVKGKIESSKSKNNE
ncbi:hypothetical protein CL622_05705 [archaeon]|nr:hypothetical protein [archaeon]